MTRRIIVATGARAAALVVAACLACVLAPARASVITATSLATHTHETSGDACTRSPAPSCCPVPSVLPAPPQDAASSAHARVCDARARCLQRTSLPADRAVGPSSPPSRVPSPTRYLIETAWKALVGVPPLPPPWLVAWA